MGGPIRSHRDLEVYKRARAGAREIFEVTRSFPAEEKYSLTDQMRRSSRSVVVNITEAWRKRRYEGAFVVKLSDAETEAAETQEWVSFGVECGYMPREKGIALFKEYEAVLKTLVGMINHAEKWLIVEKK